MNIRDWPMDQIMQLPDCCFGRQFPVFVEGLLLGAGNVWDISELGLPEQAVLWNLSVVWHAADPTNMTFRLTLGDQLPTTLAMMDALEPVLRGFGAHGTEPRYIILSAVDGFYNMPMKMPIAAAGRRAVLEVGVFTAGVCSVQVGLVVSSIPTEVPDCLLSGYLRSQ